MTEQEQAELLAAWLADADAPIPEGLDPEVVEAVLALHPERAPAPKVSIESILAGVNTGPFAANPMPAAVIAPPPLPKPANRPLRAFAVLAGGSGAMLAAALMLTVGVVVATQVQPKLTSATPAFESVAVQTRRDTGILPELAKQSDTERSPRAARRTKAAMPDAVVGLEPQAPTDGDVYDSIEADAGMERDLDGLASRRDGAVPQGGRSFSSGLAEPKLDVGGSQTRTEGYGGAGEAEEESLERPQNDAEHRSVRAKQERLQITLGEANPQAEGRRSDEMADAAQKAKSGPWKAESPLARPGPRPAPRPARAPQPVMARSELAPSPAAPPPPPLATEAAAGDAYQNFDDEDMRVERESETQQPINQATKNTLMSKESKRHRGDAPQAKKRHTRKSANSTPMADAERTRASAGSKNGTYDVSDPTVQDARRSLSTGDPARALNLLVQGLANHPHDTPTRQLLFALKGDAHAALGDVRFANQAWTIARNMAARRAAQAIPEAAAPKATTPEDPR